MSILSVPRPNGSKAERATARALKEWLTRRGLPLAVQGFRIYPYFFEAIGLWLLITRILLALGIWLRWGWPVAPIALVGLAGGLVDVATGLPLVTWPGARRAENLLLTFDPPGGADQEVILSAHYDSKSEPLDHIQRMIFLKNLRFGMLLSVLLAILGPLDGLLLAMGSPWATTVYVAGILLTLPLLVLTSGLGLNLLLGRLSPQSQGAVDNGTACAILLGLADRLSHGELDLKRTRLTIALFTGEEVNMQGSRAYTLSREWPLPAAALNLEVMAQNGPYVYWELDGNSLALQPTDSCLNAVLIAAVAEVTGSTPVAGGPINSDGRSFLQAGLPTAVLGTYDRDRRDRGFHQPTDNLGRVAFERLPEGVEILARFARLLDRDGVPGS